VSDEHRPAPGTGHDDPFGGDCPVRWMVDDIGRYLAGEGASAGEIGSAGRQAVTRAATEVNDLLRSAYSAHEVVATELRFAGPERGFRRTVFALSPTPVALMLLCMRMCDTGDDVVVLQHTAACGTSSRTATWPFGMDRAEQLTRPPARESAEFPADFPAGLDEPAG
jgi:hypothetical protein